MKKIKIIHRSDDFGTAVCFYIEAFSNGKKIGHCDLTEYRTNDNPCGRISYIHVDEEFRSQGVASKMIEYIQEEIVQDLVTSTIVSPLGAALFKKFGINPSRGE